MQISNQYESVDNGAGRLQILVSSYYHSTESTVVPVYNIVHLLYFSTAPIPENIRRKWSSLGHRVETICYLNNLLIMTIYISKLSELKLTQINLLIYYIIHPDHPVHDSHTKRLS